MVVPANRTVELVPHPTTRMGPVKRLLVQVVRTKDLSLVYTVLGNITQLRIPAPVPPKTNFTLWQHTCFEVFLAATGSSYREFNFSPSGEWGAFAYGRYRVGGTLDQPDLEPEIHSSASQDSLELRASVNLSRLGSEFSNVALRLALAAVMETRDGHLSYWALRHPPGKPDFHHPDNFILHLDRGSTDSK